MTEIRFYHLTKKTLEQGLPDLLIRSLKADKRAVVKVPSKERVATMSKHLWVCRRDEIIPHGVEGDGNHELQPIWLTEKDENPNKSDTLILVEDAQTTPENIDSYALVCEIFDGKDQDILSGARTRWKSYKDANKYDLTYWQQSDSGAWEKKI